MRRLICITGDGKGKTSSLIGMYVRSIGAGFKARFYQFLKSNFKTGENVFFTNINEIILLGYKNRNDFNYDQNDKNAAIDGFNKIKVEAKDFDFIFIDEISYVLNWKWINISDVFKLLDENTNTNFIFSGRNMPKEIIDICDTVSEVCEIKHAFKEKIFCQKGIEF